MSGKEGTVRRLAVPQMALAAMVTALIAVASQIAIPLPMVPINLGLLAIFIAGFTLERRWAMASVLLFLLMGAIGLPVFSNFGGGLGKLLGVTGGYLVGFLASALVYWLFTRLFGQAYWARLTGMLLGLAVCYAFGTAWFLVVYTKNTGAIGLWTALGWCVFPYILPDCVKIALALAIRKRLAAAIRLR